MKLHYQESGSGLPLLIIHGLFGSADNWRSMAKYFAKFYRVISVDLRNHGRSPHSDEQNFKLMAADIVELCDRLSLDRVNVLGHSLGGKVAMAFAEMQAERVHKLVVVDISPRQYFSQHTPLMDAMMALNMAQFSSRKDVDEALAADVPDPAVRQFLLMNLQPGENGLSWRINLPALKANYQALMAPVCEHAVLSIPSQFIYGGQSDYVTADDRKLIEQHFTQAIFAVIDKAGHWVHAERPQQFKQLVEEFLRDD